jgi:hypothetical protein
VEVRFRVSVRVRVRDKYTTTVGLGVDRFQGRG